MIRRMFFVLVFITVFLCICFRDGLLNVWWEFFLPVDGNVLCYCFAEQVTVGGDDLVAVGWVVYPLVIHDVDDCVETI